MMYLTDKERLTLTVLGALALVGLGVNLWQQRRPPIGIEAGPTPPVAQWESRISEARRVDVNHATAEELERLPEVGPSLAQRIVEHRQASGPFHTPEELQQVPGIGPKTFEALKEYVTVE
ncbi:MAG: helix-hairpin-helix domain-containing protein [Candidatus Omnitrophica bacterium]|nr:helix-hairpin-helix domain-containing protein [Candidatus Omnitrophota bacterium]